MFLLGRQAILGHDPPMYLRSITAVLLPCLASVHAMYLPPSPLPRTTTSYFFTFESLMVIPSLNFVHFRGPDRSDLDGHEDALQVANGRVDPRSLSPDR